MATTGESATTEIKREVKVVKKQVKKEQKIENGDQNGDTNTEAELVVKLPTKKSAAKTETKVEVNKTTLPDGTIEEVKVTTTKTTIDGRTEIKTKTEKTIIPKEEVEEVEEEEEQEEETEGEVQEAEEVVEEPVVVVKKTVKETPAVENGQKETIVKKEERSETSTTKKVVVVQKEESEEEEEEEEIEESEPVVVKKTAEKPPSPKPEEEEVVEVKEDVKEEIKEVEQEVEQEEVVTVKVKQPEPPKQEEEEDEEEVEEEYEEAEEEKIVEKKELKEEAKVVESKKQEDEESEYTEEEYESEKEEPPKEVPVKEPEPEPKEPEPKEEKPVAEVETKEDNAPPEEAKPEPKEEKTEEPAPQPTPDPEPKVSLREPSIPLEKVEEVEIKPIGPVNEIISKTHTENTEIITNTTQQPTGPLSTQTEYSRVENIVTVNRTTKALDHSYEQITQAGIPTVRTYFAPNRERIGTSPTPSKPYQPVYAPEAPTERRHSLLLDRLSTERQMPSDIYQNTYQYNNQTYDQQRQWSQEPQSEVLTVSNVKPSKITNSQWYQQNNNVIYNNVTPSAAPPPPTPTPAPASQPWSQPSPQQQYQSPPQQQYQPPPQQQYQPPPQQQYQPSYIDATAQERTTTNNYQSTNTSYPAYVPKPTNWVNNDIPTINTNLYSLSNNSTESYQKSTQQYSSSYVPPPWEQDSNYVLESQSNTKQNYYQPPPQTSTFTPSTNQGWKPTPPPAKFSKPPPTAYIPPAPNQSFVKAANVVEPPRIPGRKTYYSEYERRYITVPESTYIPGETAKFQAQPDPSPQYYYDNNEQTEKTEHEWRKELREFTEKSSQIQTTEQTSVKPPWEDDTKYAKPPSAYTPTPTWSQTLRPRSWRERSFEAEYAGSQELPKTNTLGRGRPLSSYAKSETPIPERARGVSVDRYNPNNYQSPIPAEHPPVQSHTLTPTPPATKAYHNPNVPAYHAQPRASAEPREQSVPYPQARLWGSDARGSPIQSRSFKYLQWITGTDE